MQQYFISEKFHIGYTPKLWLTLFFCTLHIWKLCYLSIPFSRSCCKVSFNESHFIRLFQHKKRISARRLRMVVWALSRQSRTTCKCVSSFGMAQTLTRHSRCTMIYIELDRHGGGVWVIDLTGVYSGYYDPLCSWKSSQQTISVVNSVEELSYVCEKVLGGQSR